MWVAQRQWVYPRQWDYKTMVGTPKIDLTLKNPQKSQPVSTPQLVKRREIILSEGFYVPFRYVGASTSGSFRSPERPHHFGSGYCTAHLMLTESESCLECLHIHHRMKHIGIPCIPKPSRSGPTTPLIARGSRASFGRAGMGPLVRV